MLVSVGSEWSRHGRVVEAAVAVVALVVVVVSSLSCRRCRSLRGRSGNRSVEKIVSGGHVSASSSSCRKEGHHKPVKIETPRLDAVVTNDPTYRITHGRRKSYAKRTPLR